MESRENRQKSDNRQMLNIPHDTLYRLEHLHGWRKGNYSGKVIEMLDAAMDLADALKAGVPEPEFKAAQVRFIAACSPKLGFFNQPQVLQTVGDEVSF